MKVGVLLCTLSVLLALAVVGAGAAPAMDKQQILQERQDLMKRQAKDLGAVKGYLEGKVGQAEATKAATDLTETMKKIPSVFPPGSEGPSPDGKFQPKPTVWTDHKDFLAHRDTAAAKVDVLLAALKGGDKAKVQASFVDLGKHGCGACHGKFREKLKD